MAKKETQKISEIMETMDAQLRKEVEMMIDRGLKTFGCCINWRDFKVYEASVKLMKLLLDAKAVEYIIAIADKADEAGLTDVKIVVKKEKETAIWSMNWNRIELMVVLSISDKRVKQLQNSL